MALAYGDPERLGLLKDMIMQFACVLLRLRQHCEMEWMR